MKSADSSTRLFDLCRVTRIGKAELELLRAARPRCENLDEYVEFLDANEDLFPEGAGPRQLPDGKRFRL